MPACVMRRSAMYPAASHVRTAVLTVPSDIRVDSWICRCVRGASSRRRALRTSNWGCESVPVMGVTVSVHFSFRFGRVQI